MDYYQISYGQGTNPSEWIAITGQEVAFTPGVPAVTWDTRSLSGAYALQLTVVMQDGTRETASSRVSVDNIPPSVVLFAGELEQVFTTDDESVPLIAEVNDDISIERVDFYHNGQWGMRWRTSSVRIVSLSIQMKANTAASVAPLWRNKKKRFPTHLIKINLPKIVSSIHLAKILENVTPSSKKSVEVGWEKSTKLKTMNWEQLSLSK